MELVSEAKCFGGRQSVFRHDSQACGGPMTFGLFTPPAAENGAVPVLWWLSGLTCTHANAMEKAGAQRVAAELGLAIVFPDTSPRGADAPDDDAYDLGQGAGFYVDATEAPWAERFQMRRYLLEDLTDALAETPVDLGRQGVSGHSMGGHGALTLAFTHPERFQSVSAFAPIANPTVSDWGRKQLAAYLGSDEAAWAEHDASLLLRSRGWPRDLLVDQGEADPFLELLRPDALDAAAADAGLDATLRRQPGYDHSYFFVATFIEDHLRWHAERLG